MRIRSLLAAGTAVSAVVVAGVAGYLFVAARSFDATLARDRAADIVTRSLFEQSEILGNYLLHREDRARSQWELKQETFSRLFDETAADGQTANPIISRMQDVHRKKTEAFARLREALQGRSVNRARPGRLTELQQHRIAELRLASQTMLSLASQLAKQAENELLRTRYELSVAVGVLIVGFVLLVSGIWFVIRWRVVRPISRLQQGIRDYRGGQVGAWQGIRSDDEIGDVAVAFDQMAENLGKVLVSRDELAKEVAIRRQAEREAHDFAVSLKARSAELDAVNKELEAFAFSVSHDLRAPLRSIGGFSEALVERYSESLDDTGRDYLRRIGAASNRMGSLINDLLTLSRTSRAKIRRTDVELSEIVSSIAEQLQLSDPARTVEFRIQTGLTAQGDDTLLRTVLENLLGNAWKYSARKVRATIEFGRADIGSGPTFYVRDNGIGFDMARADKLFKPFQRLHRSTDYEGSGIGLASVANIVRRHGGRVWADSVPGDGTTMYFTLTGNG